MLARICSSVNLIHRRDTFRASLVLQQRVSLGFLELWEFPKIGGTLFWGPSNMDPTISLGLG